MTTQASDTLTLPDSAATAGVIVRRIAPPPDDWAAPLFSSWREHGQLCVLLDRFRGDPCEADDAPGDEAGLRPTLFALEHPGFAEVPEQAPALLQLDHGTPGHLAWLDWSVRTARAQWAASPWRPSVCAWLTPAPAAANSQNPHLLPAMALQKHLSQRLHSVWHPNTPHYMRYFDPRALPGLLQVLNPAGRHALLSPVLDWFQFERDGTWLHLQPGARPAPTPQAPPTGIPLYLDALQTQALARSGALALTAQALADAGQVLPFADNPRIDAALLHAQSLGLTQKDDLVTFATHALLQGTAFTGHAELSAWCHTVQSGASLADAMAETTFGAPNRAAA